MKRATREEGPCDMLVFVGVPWSSTVHLARYLRFRGDNVDRLRLRHESSEDTPSKVRWLEVLKRRGYVLHVFDEVVGKTYTVRLWDWIQE